MALPKLYDRITWHNNTTPALNEDNLNAMSQALDDIDDRVIGLAGTIMEDVPQIIEDMEILEPAIESIDENVARAEAAAESAEQYAEEIAPPIEVVKDYADIITVEDAINKPVKDLKVKIDPVQDLHGYTKPWVGGAGKNKANIADAVVTEAGYVYNNAPLVLPSGTYTFSFESTATSGDYTIVFRDADNTELARANKNMGVKYATFTLASACAKFTLAVSATGTYSHFQIEVGSTATTYESYTNICPITGHSEAKVTRAGKQLIDKTQNVEGAINASGQEVSNSSFYRTAYIPVERSEVVLRITASTGYTFRLHGYNASGTWVQQIAAIETTDGLKTLKYSVPTGVAYVRLSYPKVYVDSTALYDGDDFIIDLGGTRYLCEYSATDGALKVLGLYDEITSVNRGTITSGKFCWYVTDYAATIKKPVSSDLVANIKCNFAPTESFSNLSAGTEGIAVHSNGNVFLYVKPWEDMTAPQVNAILAETPLQIVYELATPQTITLDPTVVTLLWEYNTLFADTGDLSLTYDASGVLRIAGPLEERVDALENSPEIISNANGEAYKFPSGVLICTKQYKATSLACTNSWGVLYESPLIDFGDWAYPFITSPDGVSAIVIGGQGGWLEYLVGGTATKVGKTYLVRPTANTADTTFSITGIGRWK